ncbi:hypothetical protein M413DRAFT_449333 [Hebeloma cylindrosporum]|uniref:Uncharacterized protein n=1 Tax=Hebeloma cylindrosporum TaxID=76867 RepID=A0A0C2XEE9_HEBCY|nr:hypothetical protein M413DRAFT_449333 [Hebeloma cylindrosporum h7]
MESPGHSGICKYSWGAPSSMRFLPPSLFSQIETIETRFFDTPTPYPLPWPWAPGTLKDIKITGSFLGLRTLCA